MNKKIIMLVILIIIITILLMFYINGSSKTESDKSNSNISTINSTQKSLDTTQSNTFCDSKINLYEIQENGFPQHTTNSNGNIETNYITADMGYNKGIWVDAEGTGRCHNYCRIVGGSASIISCFPQNICDSASQYNFDIDGNSTEPTDPVKQKLWKLYQDGFVVHNGYSNIKQMIQPFGESCKLVQTDDQKSNECPFCQSYGTTSSTNMNCYRKPTNEEIGNMGYPNFRSWLDVEGTGNCFNYCRLTDNGFSCTSQVKNNKFTENDKNNVDYTVDIEGTYQEDSIKQKLKDYYNRNKNSNNELPNNPTPCTL